MSLRRDYPHVKKEKYVKPKVELIEPPEGSFWICRSCGKDRFGKFVNGVLEVKYRDRIMTVDGVVVVHCLRCGWENKLDLRSYPYKVSVHTNAEPWDIEATQAAIKMADEAGVDLNEIQIQGKVTVSDVRAYLQGLT